MQKRKRLFGEQSLKGLLFCKKLEIMTENDIDDNFCPYKVL